MKPLKLNLYLGSEVMGNWTFVKLNCVVQLTCCSVALSRLEQEELNFKDHTRTFLDLPCFNFPDCWLFFFFLISLNERLDLDHGWSSGELLWSGCWWTMDRLCCWRRRHRPHSGPRTQPSTSHALHGANTRAQHRPRARACCNARARDKDGAHHCFGARA